MGATVVKRAFKYRVYPTPAQAVELSQTFGCVRKVYNLALEARTAAWYQEQRRVTYCDTSALLTGWKKTDELSFLNEVSCVPLQQTLRHLQSAFARFWEKRAKYPKFKSRKRGKSSAEYTKSAFRWREGQLAPAKMTEPLAIVWSRPLPEGAEPSTVTVSRDPAGRWHVSILVETAITHLPPTTAQIGVDVGITALVTLSTGEKITNPQHSAKDRVRLARAIADAAWSELRSMLEYKAAWYGREVVAIDRWYPSSKTCSGCGHLLDRLPLGGRTWTCPSCGMTQDRDVNAARNILAAGRAVAAWGAGVRPTRH